MNEVEGGLRTSRINLQVSAHEKACIREAAEKNEVSISDYVRNAVFDRIDEEGRACLNKADEA